MASLSVQGCHGLFAFFLSVFCAFPDAKPIAATSKPATIPEDNQLSLFETRVGTYPPSEFLRYETYLFTAMLKMGDGSDLNVLVDTGSGDLVVASSACSTVGCGHHRRFKPTRDRHGYFLGANPVDIHLSYATGDILGEGFEGQVCFAETCGSTSFVVASWESGNFARYKFDAVLGLGPKQRSFAKGFNLIDAFARQGALQAPTFSLDLCSGLCKSSLRFGVQGAPSGVVALSANESITSLADATYPIVESSVHWLPVGKDSSEWAIPMMDIALNSMRLNACGAKECLAVLDSGCGGIALPAAVAKRVKSILHVANCSALADLPRLDFLIRGKTYTVRPERYMKVSKANASRCWPLIYEQPEDVVGTVVLGLPFLFGRLTTFDAGSMMVGFG